MKIDKKWILCICVGVVVIIAIAVYVGMRMGKNVPAANGNKTVSVVSAQGYLAANDPNALPTVEGGTRVTIKNDIATPDQNASAVPAGVAVPVNVINTGPISFRQFNISGVKGQFSPDTIVVNEGDIIDLTLSATDGTYDMYFPDFAASLTASKGKTAHVQFQATIYGQYQFYCATSCSGNPQGTLIVNKK